MSVEQAIHERWASDEALSNLVPVERLVTGALAESTGAPLRRGRAAKERAKTRTSSRAIEEATVRLTIWAADLDQARAIAVEIVRVFERSSFALAAGKVLNMQRTQSVDKIQQDSTWRTLVDYHVTYEL